MDKYYHFTSFNNFYNIMKKGLIPQKGFRCYSINDDNYGVFLSKGIDNSIRMYAYMLSYYEKVKGIEGDQTIQDCLNELHELYQKIPSYRNKMKIDECISTINRVNIIKRCRSFVEYLGGYGCLLSIEGIIPDNIRSLEDCRCDKVILPSNINLVSIRDKKTNYYIYNLDAVFSYLMYLYPLEKVIENVEEENCNSIKKLYKYRDESYYKNFDSSYFDLFEIPIVFYDYDYQKILRY